MTDQPEQTPPAAQTGNEAPAPKTFTQDEVSAMMTKEKSQGERAAIRALLEKLGLDDAKSLESIVTAHKQQADAEKSELERLQAALQQAQQQADAEKAKAKTALIRSAVIAAASKADFVDPADAYAQFLLDNTEFTMDDKGNIEGVDAAIQALATAKPHLLKKGETQPQSTASRMNPTNPGGVPATPDLSWHAMNRLGNNNPFAGGQVVLPKKE